MVHIEPFFVVLVIEYHLDLYNIRNSGLDSELIYIAKRSEIVYNRINSFSGALGRFLPRRLVKQPH